MPCGGAAEDGQAHRRARPHQDLARRANPGIRTWSRRWSECGPPAAERHDARVIGGRYGHSSESFTPAMVAAVYQELTSPAQTDVQRRHSRRRDEAEPGLRSNFSTERRRGSGRVSSGWGATARWRQPQLGEDRGREHALHAQGYFVYDSRRPARSPPPTCVSARGRSKAPIWSIGPISWPVISSTSSSGSTCCSDGRTGGDVLINSPYSADRGLGPSADRVQQQIIDKNLKF